MADDLNSAVEKWWAEHPFTYAGDMRETFDQEAVGRSLAFFEKVERRLRRHAPTYQAPGAPLLSNFIDYRALKGKRVLDIATGTGVLAVEFARQGAEVTAIDLTQTSVDMARRNLALRGLDGQVLKMDAQALEFPEASFDFVAAHGCLMHMPDTRKAISEMYRVLRPGGRFYAWLYHKGWYYYFNILFVRGICLGGLARNGFDIVALTSRYTDGLHFGGNPHTKFYSSAELRDLFSQAGFGDLDIAVTYNPMLMDAWPMKKLPLGRMLPESVRFALGRRLCLGVRVLGRK